jgi:CMP-N,N'-diacetyllegionaminic acid synthase
VANGFLSFLLRSTAKSAMARSLNIIALIPARGGSKAIPRKNIRLLGGKPLIAHTIEHAQLASSVGRVIVSTDDPQVENVAREWGAEVIKRRAEISGDSATSESALLDALDQLVQTESYSPDLVVFLQCTSPIRRSDDIDRAVETLIVEQADSLLSVVPSHAFLWRIANGQALSFNYDYHHRPRRQDWCLEYKENGSIYVFKPWVLRESNNRLGGKIAIHVMEETSAQDIDTLEDLELCECLMSRSQYWTSNVENQSE